MDVENSYMGVEFCYIELRLCYININRSKGTSRRIRIVGFFNICNGFCHRSPIDLL